ncbi:leucine-rich repeat protein [Allofournierella sp.]|uniref:leucine-rich repeat protein n=1 Tax=Allofournierella sp. TaxID=1940256 RepID=UPI003AB7B087
MRRTARKTEGKFKIPEKLGRRLLALGLCLCMTAAALPVGAAELPAPSEAASSAASNNAASSENNGAANSAAGNSAGSALSPSGETGESQAKADKQEDKTKQPATLQSARAQARAGAAKGGGIGGPIAGIPKMTGTTTGNVSTLDGVSYREFTLTAYDESNKDSATTSWVTGTVTVSGTAGSGDISYTIPEKVQRTYVSGEVTNNSEVDPGAGTYCVFTVTAVSPSAFKSWTGSRFTLPGTIETIGGLAFCNATNGVDVSNLNPEALANTGAGAFAGTTVYVASDAQAAAIPPSALKPQVSDGNYTGRIVKKQEGGTQPISGEASTARIAPVTNGDTPGFTLQYKDENNSWQDTLAGGAAYGVYLSGQPVALRWNGQETYINGASGGKTWSCAVKAEVDVTDGAQVTLTARNCGNTAIPDFNLVVVGNGIVAGSMAELTLNTPLRQDEATEPQHKAIIAKSGISANFEEQKYYHLSFEGNNALWLNNKKTTVDSYGNGWDNSYIGGNERSIDNIYSKTHALAVSVGSCTLENENYHQQKLEVNEERTLSIALNKVGGGDQPPAEAEPQSVSVSPATLSLAVSGTQQLTATVSPANAPQGVTWSSSNTSVAAVDANGKVTAIAEGTAVITAASTKNAALSAGCTVTVADLLAEAAEKARAALKENLILPNGSGADEVLKLVNTAIGDSRIIVAWQKDPTVTPPTASDYGEIQGTLILSMENYQGTGTVTVQNYIARQTAITLLLNGKTPVGDASLEKAITYSSGWWNIQTVEVMGGKFTAGDWNFLAEWETKVNELSHSTNLASFSIRPAVTEVAPMPDRTSAQGALFPSTIESVSVPQVSRVADYALNKCASLTSANFANAAEIGEGAFSGCSNLAALALPKVTTIGAEALKSNIASLALPAAPPTVAGGHSAFGSGPETRKLTFVDESGNELAGDALARAIANYQNDAAACNTDKTRWWGWLNGGEAVDTTLEDAKARVEKAVSGYKPAQGSTAEKILEDMQAAADGDGEQGKVTVSWKAGSPAITPATLEAAGSIAGTLVLRYGGKTQEIEVKWALPQLERSITIKTSTGALKEYKGKNLEAAITALGYQPSTLVVTEGQFLKEDWLYCKNLTTTKTFEIKEGVLVEDIPGSEADGTEPVSIFPQGYDSKLKSVTVPQAIAIGDGAFANNKNLETVNMPNATRVGAKAFYGCWNVTAIEMNRATAVGDDAFGECINLATVSMENAVTIGARAFASRNDPMKLSAIGFPAAATIGERAFYDCKQLERASFPQVTEIGALAFKSCNKLKTISFPKAIKVGDEAFAACYMLETVKMEQVETLGKGALKGNSGLKTLNLPKLKTLGEGALESCRLLTTVQLPKLESIGGGAFKNCGDYYGSYATDKDKLARWVELELPATPPTVGEGAFEGCAGVGDTLPGTCWLTPVGEDGTPLKGQARLDAQAAYRAVEDGNTTDSLWYCWMLPSEVEGEGGPAGNRLTAAVNGGRPVSANSLKKALELAGITEKGTTGQNYQAVKELVVSAGRFTVDDWDLIDQSNNSGTYLQNLESLVVQQGVAPAAMLEGKGDDVHTRYPFFPYSIRRVEVHGLTAVPRCAMPGTNIESVCFPDATSIGEYAFEECSSLSEIPAEAFPQVTVVGGHAFEKCDGGVYSQKGLARVSLPKAQTLKSAAFKGCQKLTEVSLPSVVMVGSEVFQECKKLTRVRLETATELGESAFYLCKALQTAEFPQVKTVGKLAFYGCEELESVSLPKAEALREGAFEYCEKLQALWLPSVTQIGKNAFMRCQQLGLLTLGATPPAVTESTTAPKPGRTVTPVGADGAALTGDALQTAVEAYLAAEDGDTSDNLWYGWQVTGAAAVSLSFSQQPEAAQVLSGESHTFAALALASNGAPVTYTWYVQGPGESGGTQQPGAGSSLALAKANNGSAPKDEYTVWCVASAAGVSDAESDKVTLTVLRTSTVGGTVTDQSGAAVPGASVTLTDGAGKEYGPATTGEDGRWSIPGVPDGEYTVTVVFPNGSKVEKPGVKIPGEGGGADLGGIVKPVSIELSGKVTDYTGAAVPGAEVTVINGNTHTTYGPAITNEQGQWSIKDVPAGSYTIRVKLPGGETLELEIQVTEEGKVTDREGNALNDLDLQQPAPTISFTTQPVGAQVLSGESHTFSVAATASNGVEVSYEWHIKATGGADERLEGTGSSVTVTKTSLGTAAEDAYVLWCVAKADHLADCKSDEVTLTVLRTSTITGTVKDKDSAPVKDAEVTVKDQGGKEYGPATTDQDGKWSIDGVPDGEYTVTVVFPNGSKAEKPDVTVPGTGGGGAVDTGELQKPPAATITGTVTDHEGNPLAGAAVEMAKEGSTYKTAATDQSGAWSIGDVPQGSYTLTASVAGSADRATGAVAVDEQGTVTGNTALKMPAPTIRFTAHPQNANALSGESHTFSAEAQASNGAAVSCQWYLADMDGANREDLGTGGSVTVSKTITEAEKQYKVWCEASAKGAAPVKSDEATLTVRQPVDLSGTVTDRDGAPVQGAEVTVTDKSGNEAGKPTTDADGKWTIPGVPAGEYEVTVTFPDGSTATGSVTVNPDGSVSGSTDLQQPQKADIIFDKHPAGGSVPSGGSYTFSAQAHAENGKPVSYNWYLAGHAPGDKEYTEAAPQHLGSGASVTLDNKNTGTNANYTYTVWCVASAAGAQDTPSNKAALAVLHTSTAGGTVTDEAGAPVQGAEVTVKDQDGKEYGPATTDQDGGWTIPGVPDGRYDVVVKFPNGGGEVVKPDVTVPMEGGTSGDVVKPGQGGFRIAGQPQAVTVAKNEPARFAVQVTAVTGTRLTYQWYKNTQNSNQGGTPIDGAAEAAYAPGTGSAGVSYYYCVVSAGGVSKSSAAAALTVQDNAPQPTATPGGGQGEVPAPTAAPTPAPTPAATKGPGAKPTPRPTAAQGEGESEGEGGAGGKSEGTENQGGGAAPGTAGGQSGGSDGTVPGKLEGGVIVLAPAGGQSGGTGSAGENGDSQSGASQNGTGTGGQTLVKTHSQLVAEVGQGRVIVTVSEFEGKRMAAIGDTQGLINAALSPEQKRQVDAGETIELRLDVKQLEGQAPGADRALIEQELRQPGESLPALTLGAYLDISLYMRVGQGDWSPVPTLDGEVQIVMDLPEELRGLEADFYVLRAHGGASDLLPDEDQDPATVTIHTGRFSTYAIAYLLRKTGCGLCGMCPAPLGVCVFLWLLLVAVLAAGGACLWYFVRKKRG